MQVVPCLQVLHEDSQNASNNNINDNINTLIDFFSDWLELDSKSNVVLQHVVAM